MSTVADSDSRLVCTQPALSLRSRSAKRFTVKTDYDCKEASSLLQAMPNFCCMVQCPIATIFCVACPRTSSSAPKVSLMSFVLSSARKSSEEMHNEPRRVLRPQSHMVLVFFAQIRRRGKQGSCSFRGPQLGAWGSTDARDTSRGTRRPDAATVLGPLREEETSCRRIGHSFNGRLDSAKNVDLRAIGSEVTDKPSTYDGQSVRMLLGLAEG